MWAVGVDGVSIYMRAEDQTTVFACSYEEYHALNI